MTGFHSRRVIVKAALAGTSTVLAPAVIPSYVRAANQTLYVNSYGGEQDVAWKKAFFDPFTQKTGVTVKTVSPVNFALLRAQVLNKSYEWDITCINETELTQAQVENLATEVPKSVAATLPGYLVVGHGIGAYNLATALAFRRDKVPNGGPESWADFWDVQRFPGDRSLFNRSFTCLCYALLADGVPAKDLYPLDIERAYRKLDQIKPHIKVWWSQAAQSQQLLRDGEVRMMGLWSSRAAALIASGAPIQLVWNGAENYTTYWLVPTGAPKAELAWQFAQFAAQPEPQAAFSNLIPYGPANVDALKFISEDRIKLMPSAPQNAPLSFKHDNAWLVPRLNEIRERWTQWLAS